ncbi:DUF4870 domain-containing protein, partial [Propionicimonas sp.]|uniref:DUF4870 domain-containing protein n=1 Tax=Propionicimonas sp. TaxID=1955623 RepID=UPI0039E54AD0
APTPEPASGAAPVTGGGDVENLARQAYGEPATEPAPPPAGAPYADSPYAASPGAFAPAAEPTYAQPHYAQPAYAPQPGFGPSSGGQLVPNAPLPAADQQTWATAAHWSSLLLSLVSLPFLGPLLIMLIQGPKDPRVRANAVESLNFDLTCIIAMVASFLLMLVLIGFVTAPIVGIFWVVFKVVATIQTANGRDYRYPLTIRMVK